MATITAAKAGNWSDTTVWNGGVVPGNGDTADLNGYVVAMDIATIPASGTLLAIQSPAKAGQLTLALDTLGNSTINATTITPGTVGTGGFIRVSGGPSNTLTINGNIAAGASRGVYFNSPSTLTVNGNVTGGSSGTTSHGIYNLAGTVNVIGNVTGGSSGTTSHGIYNLAGTVNVIGNVTGGSNAAGTYGIYNTSTGAITITGNLTGGSANFAYAVNNASTAVVTLNSCNMINSTTALAYSGYPPTTWNLNANNYIQWGSVKFSQELPVGQILAGIVSGDETGTLAMLPKPDFNGGLNG